ncbi:MAG: hypothetical protein U5R31_16790 [Acidimicrobiia bacterium]|nr:hypothetical protein [Acidimicrobiia bacterium]
MGAAEGYPATLAVADDGSLTLHGIDGYTYVFDAEGELQSATNARDIDDDASMDYTWTTITSGDHTYPRMTKATDPVSGRDITLTYEDGTGNCPVRSGYEAPPVGMLCEIDWWDNTTTTLDYDNDLLRRIENPGDELHAFGYNSGSVVTYRDPLAHDAAAAGVRSGWGILHWILNDGNADPAERKATSVAQPEARGR